MGFIVAAYNVYMYYIVPIVSEFLELLCDLDITTGILAQCHELPRKSIKIIPPHPLRGWSFLGVKNSKVREISWTAEKIDTFFNPPVWSFRGQHFKTSSLKKYLGNAVILIDYTNILGEVG